jgi:hypothetical protein
MAASLGAAAKKSVTGVCAPSYASGVHMWNGTADTLNANPTRSRPIAMKLSTPLLAFRRDMTTAISSSLVVPAMP